MPSLLSRLELTWFCKNMPSRTDLKVGDVLDEISASFSDWQAVTPFRFSEAADGVPADFQIVFGSVGQSDAGGQYDGNSSGGTITLDDRRTWSSFRDRLKSQTSAGSNPLSLPLSVITKLEDAFNDGSRVDLRSILLHEIGHAILGGNGNEDHSTAPHSVMAETVTPDTMYYTAAHGITDDDAIRVDRAYESQYALMPIRQLGYTWTYRGRGFRTVTLLSDGSVAAIDQKGDLKRYVPPVGARGSRWETLAQGVDQVAEVDKRWLALLRGSKVETFDLTTRTLKQLPSDSSITAIAGFPPHRIYASAPKPAQKPLDLLCDLDPETGTGFWATSNLHPGAPLISLSAGKPAGHLLDLWGLAADGRAWRFLSPQFDDFQPVEPPLRSLCVAADGTVFGIDKNDPKLWLVYQDVTPMKGWLMMEKVSAKSISALSKSDLAVVLDNGWLYSLEAEA